MSFPIQPHSTWNIKDSSKLDDYLTCPRKYFYLHILGWKLDQPAHDLWFGSCWHAAREHQLLFGYHDIVGAFNKFESKYREQFAPETDPIYNPKVPAGVLSALMYFNTERSLDLVENEVVEIDGVKMTEISGTVPVSDTRHLHYKMDSIMHRLEGDWIFSWDHKSTSGKWIHDTRWDSEYHLSMQNGTYTHCLYCMFPIERVLGVEFIKTGFEFLERGSKNRPAGYHSTTRYVQAFKTPDQMNNWLWNVNSVLDEIDRDMDKLFHCNEEDYILQSFRMNPKSCTSYSGCQFHDYCLAWQNPLQQCHQPPLGFREEFWDPSAQETHVKKDLKIYGL